MTIQNLITILDEWAPPAYGEDFDNVGLLVGDAKKECLGALITLDCTEDVMEEAINKKCNLIISFHPIVFSGLKKITGKNHVERVVIKAIQNDIAISCTLDVTLLYTKDNTITKHVLTSCL